MPDNYEAAKSAVIRSHTRTCRHRPMRHLTVQKDLETRVSKCASCNVIIESFLVDDDDRRSFWSNWLYVDYVIDEDVL